MRPTVVLPPERTTLRARSINGLLRDYPELAAPLIEHGIDVMAAGGGVLQEAVTDESRLDQLTMKLESVLEWRRDAGRQGAARLPGRG